MVDFFVGYVVGAFTGAAGVGLSKTGEEWQPVAPQAPALGKASRGGA